MNTKVSGASETESSSPIMDDTQKDNPTTFQKKRSRLPIYITTVIVVIGLISAALYWVYSRQFETTDDAFVEGDIIQVSPKISAYVTKVYVKDNQFVHKGDLLVELGAKDFEAKRDQAVAQLHIAQAEREQARAGVGLTRKTTDATRSQAVSNIKTSQSNVEQTRQSAQAKEILINQAQSAVKTAEAELAQSNSQIPQAEANLQLAQADELRYRQLLTQGDISQQRYDQSLALLKTAQAQLNAVQKQAIAAQSRVNQANVNVKVARENYNQAVSQIDLTKSQVDESAGRLKEAETAPEQISVSKTQVLTADAKIEQAQTFVNQAELELSYTKIFAPEDGYITQKNVLEGQLVQPGAVLMAVSQGEVWVIANFKETQIDAIRVGQSVDIKIDAFPYKTFRGTVESLQAGTGSRFSVLPAENSSGNFVKVVQRVPIKIVFDQRPDKSTQLVPGMSVVPKIKVR